MVLRLDLFTLLLSLNQVSYVRVRRMEINYNLMLNVSVYKLIFSTILAKTIVLVESFHHLAALLPLTREFKRQSDSGNPKQVILGEWVYAIKLRKNDLLLNAKRLKVVIFQHVFRKLRHQVRIFVGGNCACLPQAQLRCEAPICHHPQELLLIVCECFAHGLHEVLAHFITVALSVGFQASELIGFLCQMPKSGFTPGVFKGEGLN